MSLPRVDSQPFFQATESSQRSPKRDCLDLVAKSMTTKDGAGDLFRGLENLFGYFPYLPLEEGTQKTVQQMRLGADLCAAALSIPALFINVNELRHHVTDWLSSCNKDATSQKVDGAFSRVVRESFLTANSATQAALCLHSARVVNLGEALSSFTGVYQASTIVTDSWDLTEQIERVQNPESELDFQYGMLMIAKDISSIIGAAILLVGLFFVALAEACVVILLGLSSVYVISSILAYIWKEKMEEQKLFPLPLA